MQFPSLLGLALLIAGAVASPSAELTLVAPEASYLSPVCVEGTMPAGLPAVTRDGHPARSRRLGPQAWYSDVALVPDLPLVVTVSAADQQLSRSVTWTSVDLAGPALTLVARPGDRVAPRTSGVRLEVVSPDGVTTLLRTVAGVPRPYLLRDPGDYRFRNPGASEGLTVRVYVPTVRPDPQQPVAVLADGHSYDFPLPVAPDTAGLACTSADPDLSVARSGSGVALAVRSIGSHLGAVRLGSASGPILGTVAVIGYQLEVSKALEPLPVASDGTVAQPGILTVIGSETEPQRFRARIVMKPWLPNVKLIFTKFAHPAYFLGGASTFVVLSDGSPSTLGEPGFTTARGADGTPPGTFDYTIISPPGNRSQCVSIECRTLFGGTPVGLAWLVTPDSHPSPRSAP